MGIKSGLYISLTRLAELILSVTHHRQDAVFSSYRKPWSGLSEGGWAFDFLGVKTDPSFFYQPNDLLTFPKGHVHTAYPHVDEQYPEWVFLLETVYAYKDEKVVVFCDLGAGYGAWLTAAFFAFTQLNRNAAINLVGVEADARHFEFLVNHLKNNGIDPDGHILWRKAVTGDRRIVMMEEGPRDITAYGSRIRSGTQAGDKASAVASVTISDVVQAAGTITYLTIDIQGSEWEALEKELGVLDQNVKRLQLATHSPMLHRKLAQALKDLGWRNQFMFPHRRISLTRWGLILFRDGCQSWINPRFESGARSA